MSHCCCHDDCCDQVVPVTVEENTINIDGSDVTITVENVSPIDATKKQITIDAGAEDFFNFHCKFVDNANLPGVVSPSPPDQEDAEFVKTSDSLGESIFEVEHQGATDTWYLVVELFGALIVSDPIVIGV